jgi:hypothetical protein
MIPVEIVPGMGREWGRREIQMEVNSSVIYLIYCKNFCKYHIVPHPEKQ